MILHYGDMTDSSCLVKIISAVRPEEIYNLARQGLFDLSGYTAEVDAVGTLRLLDVIRTCGLEKSVKFYQTSSLELHRKVLETPQNEKTPYNHESPRRRENFVSRKITRTVAKIFLGQLT